MSFRNTHTPRRAEIVGKARYQCPMHKVGCANAYYLTPELEAHFRRLFPTTLNRDMMRIFGISFETMQRFKRKLGLTKNMTTIRRKQSAIVKKICEENGYYDSLRGKAPSEACQEASRKKRSAGFHPLRELKHTNPRKYRKMLEKMSEKRKTLYAKERLREYNGIERDTKLHIPYRPYTKKHTSMRYLCKKNGYITGDNRTDRWSIYYTDQTQRNPIREQHGIKMGFTFCQKSGQ